MRTWLMVAILCALMLWGCYRVDKWAEDALRNITDARWQKLEQMEE